MNILDKYKYYRDELETGDVILTTSDKLMATIIKAVDNKSVKKPAKCHHSELIKLSCGRVEGLGAHPDRCRPDYLSQRIIKKKWSDFCILRPQVSSKDIQIAMNKASAMAEIFNKYDYGFLREIAFYQLFGVEKKSNSPHRLICSELTQYYGIQLGIEEYEEHNLSRPFFLPSDHLNIKTDKLKIIVNFEE